MRHADADPAEVTAAIDASEHGGAPRASCRCRAEFCIRSWSRAGAASRGRAPRGPPTDARIITPSRDAAQCAFVAAVRDPSRPSSARSRRRGSRHAGASSCRARRRFATADEAPIEEGISPHGNLARLCHQCDGRASIRVLPTPSVTKSGKKVPADRAVHEGHRTSVSGHQRAEGREDVGRVLLELGLLSSSTSTSR